ncbi:DMT family transporter [Marinitoga litoralis]|uniref:DMT family transporter n=1 Tax=Marinitoga litoralis TaxID=570855 RepID=UPI00195FBB69|nr:DMT family transporter [Marinitoga litoralis]MBM7558384.1 drug/metabolite transporter (DMT)-like permease [Marinitoga litoralis]
MKKVIISGLLMSFIFGTSFLFTKNALDYVSPFEFLAFRFSIAFLTMTLLLLFGVFKLQRKNYLKLWKVIIFQPILYFIFETTGINLIPSSEAGIIIASIPIMISFIAPYFLKEKPPKKHYIYVFTSFFGALLILGFNSFKGNLLGDLLVFGAVISATFYNIVVRLLKDQFSPFEITYSMMLSGAVFFNLFIPDYTLLANKTVFVSAIYLGIFSSVITFFLLNYMISKASPIQTSIFANLTTVISVLAGFLFRNEIIYWYHIVGMLLIIFGVWKVNTEKIRKIK